MLWQDLRQYLDKLESLGDLKRVEGANWEEDIGGITELMTERQGPALLFDQIQGYPPGYRVASNLFTTPKRTAVAFGMDPSSEGLAERWHEIINKFKPAVSEFTGKAMDSRDLRETRRLLYLIGDPRENALTGHPPDEHEIRFKCIAGSPSRA